MVEFDDRRTLLASHTGCRRDRRRRVRTVSVKVASVVTPQLSVARIVIVWGPIGAALLIETIPVTLSTEIVPV